MGSLTSRPKEMNETKVPDYAGPIVPDEATLRWCYETLAALAVQGTLSLKVIAGEYWMTLNIPGKREFFRTGSEICTLLSDLSRDVQSHINMSNDERILRHFINEAYAKTGMPNREAQEALDRLIGELK